jgi:hypothetical protein
VLANHSNHPGKHVLACPISPEFARSRIDHSTVPYARTGVVLGSDEHLDKHRNQAGPTGPVPLHSDQRSVSTRKGSLRDAASLRVLPRLWRPLTCRRSRDGPNHKLSASDSLSCAIRARTIGDLRSQAVIGRMTTSRSSWDYSRGCWYSSCSRGPARLRVRVSPPEPSMPGQMWRLPPSE